MLQKISTGSSCDPLPYDAARVDHILLCPDFSCHLSCAYLTLLDKSSSMIDGRLNGLFRCGPKLVGCLFLLCRSWLDVWKRPFEVEGQMKVSLVVAVGDNITDESASVEVSKIGLRACQLPIPTADVQHAQRTFQGLRRSISSRLFPPGGPIPWRLVSWHPSSQGSDMGRNRFESDGPPDQRLCFLQHLGA